MATATNATNTAAEHAPVGGISRALLDAGVVTPEQLAYAERVRAKLGVERPLFDLLREIFSIGDARLRDALERQRDRLKLGELLVELGYLRQEFLELALSIQRDEKSKGERRRIGEILIDHHLIDETKLAEALAIHLGFPLEAPGLVPLDAALVAELSADACERHGFVPLRRHEGRVVVAFSDPMDPDAVAAARAAFGADGVAPAIAERAAIRAALARLAGRQAPAAPVAASPSTVVDLLDEILDEAIGAAACAIHLEPRADGIALRLREDGVLSTRRVLPLSLAPALVHHLRVLCRGEDGSDVTHFVHRSGAQTCEVRMASCAIAHGERIVLRLLDVGATPASLDAIGASPLLLGRLRAELSRPSGLLLLASPPGGGRSATLHACLAALAGANTALAIVESPGARRFEGAAQFVRGRDRERFADTWLRALAQDPDVIALDEIDSPESAQAAVAAAAAGRRVVATCAAEDAVGAYLRIAGFGVDRPLLASALGGVLAQQLLRRVCDTCAQPDVSRTARRFEQMLLEPDGRFLAGHGCAECRTTGFRGRAGVFELLGIGDDERRRWIAEHASGDSLRAASVAAGVVTLFEDGVARAARGHVSIAEVARRLPPAADGRSLAEILGRTGR